MIEDVKIIPLKQIPDERGTIFHMLRADSPHFQKFGEIYFATAYPGVIKGWHVHKTMTLNYAVIIGMVKLVLYDNRKNSKTRGVLQELFIGEKNYCLVQIPPGIVNGWKCVGTETAYLANCATEPNDPREIIRIDPFTDEIPYSWDIVFK